MRWVAVWVHVVRAIAGELAPGIYAEGGCRHFTDGEYFAKWARKSHELRVINAAVVLLGDMPCVRLSAALLDTEPLLAGLDEGIHQ